MNVPKPGGIWYLLVYQRQAKFELLIRKYLDLLIKNLLQAFTNSP